MNVGIIARTIVARMLLVLLIIVFLLPIIIFMIIPQRWRYSSRFIFMLVHLFYQLILKCALVPVKYKGKENIPREPAIFIGNHQSSLDIPLMGALSGHVPHIWLAKEELMDSILVRFVIPLIAVLVDMKSAQKAMLSLRKIIMLVNRYHANVMLFPEGGRYTDDKIHDFFSGFVVLARTMQRPVVPVCIVGVNKVYPPDSLLVYYHPITVVIGEPFVLGTDEKEEDFKKRVQQWFVETLEKIQ
jgi:1-acyl-sn-glycerol-3-phosphate acyltransferase